MTIAIKHAFTSLKGDGTDATLVQPSQWNAAHTTSMASGNILGRVSAGVGSFEELPASQFVINALNSADGISFLNSLGIGGFRSGDAKFTFQTTPETGWIMADDGSIGDASSGATSRNNADTVNLFTVLYNAVSDTWAPILTSAGVATTRAAQGTAAAAFAAHCRMVLPKTLGRALACAGGGSGLSGRSIAQYLGEENHTLTNTEIPPHTHSGTTGTESAQHTHAQSVPAAGNAKPNGTGTAPYDNMVVGGGVTGPQNQNHTHNFTTDNGTGGGGAHNNMQPTLFLNVEIKL